MPSSPNVGSLKERFGALRTLRPFIAMVWRTSPSLTVSSLTLRLVRVLLPVVTDSDRAPGDHSHGSLPGRPEQGGQRASERTSEK